MPRWFGRRRPKNDDEEVIREVLQIDAVLCRYPDGTRLSYGAPTRCPACGDYGLVEAVDAVACSNRCLGCATTWRITRRALRIVADPAARVALFGEVPILGEEGVVEPEPAGALYLPVQPSLELPAPPATLAIASGDLQVLLVEDDPMDADLVRTLMQPFEPDGVSLVHATTRAEGERLVTRDETIDLVLLDLGLPDSNGLSTLSHWKPQRSSPPVVVLSGNDNAALADAVVQMGASMYVHKHQLTDLMAAGEKGSAELITTLRSVTRGEAELSVADDGASAATGRWA